MPTTAIVALCRLVLAMQLQINTFLFIDVKYLIATVAGILVNFFANLNKPFLTSKNLC
jgi:hypothetical protein